MCDVAFSNYANFADESQYADVAIPLDVLNTSASASNVASNCLFTTNNSTWTVTSTGDSETTEGTLRYAITNAAAGDTIIFDSTLKGETITLSGSQLDITKSLTIDASALYDSTTNTPGIIIDANQKSRVFCVEGSTSDAQVELIGLKITNGKISGIGAGGGVYVYYGATTLTNCTITQNTAYYGGGVYTLCGTPILTNCTITQNTASNIGGGVCAYEGTPTLTNCMIIQNIASSGGGVYTSGTPTLTNCTITQNTASYNGGGVYTYEGARTLTNCMIAGNVAGYGGGIYAYYGATTAKNCTITENVARDNYGGVYTCRGTCDFYNTIIACNSLTGGSSSDVYSTSTFNAYNVLSSYANWTTSENCLVYDSTLPLLVDTSNGDYSLAANSQAINKGNSAYAVDADGNALTTDLAGNARIFGNSVDLGAYEYVPKGDVPSLVVTTELDVVDETDGLISLREAITYVSTNGLGTTITFDPSLKDKTITLNGTQLEITKSLTIDASALYDETSKTPGITIDANKKSRVFNITDSTTEATVHIIGLTITGGKSSKEGGGIYTTEKTMLTNCSFVGNTALRGGGICVHSGTTSIDNCVISENDGGGVYVEYGTTTLYNCVLTENVSQSTGGGIDALSGAPTLINCTVAGNVANYGGGISGRITLYNSIVSGNFAFKANADCEGSISTNSSNNAIGFDPGFMIAPLFDDYGNLLNADTMNLHLSSEAWGIDRGDNSFVLGSVDFDGNERIVQSYSSSAVVDLGAYEYQSAYEKIVEIPSTVVTTTLDVVDDTDGLISLREAAFVYAKSGETVTFDASVLDGGEIVLQGASIIVNKVLTIDASSLTNGLTINCNNKSNAFSISGGTTKSSIAIVGLTIINGNASAGGGITIDRVSDSQKSFVDLKNLYLSTNSARWGGGLFSTYSVVSLTNCTFENNTTLYQGGAIYSTNKSTLTNCKIINNKAGDYGGAIYATSHAISKLTNCVLAGNQAKFYGGGIYSTYSTTLLINCSITENISDQEYGGICLDNSECNLWNTIVAKNESKSTSSYPDVGFRKKSSYNAFNVLSSYSDWTTSENCLVYDSILPLFADSDNGDYTLAEGSQAIDKGNVAYAVDADWNPLTTDLAGNARIFGTSVDIGAYEYVPKGDVPSLVVTTELDVVDDTDGLISLREAIAYVSTNGLGTTITFDLSLKGKTIKLNGTQLEIDKSLTIDASALYDATSKTPGITIDANKKSRVISIDAGTTDAPVNLIGLAITGGRPTTGDGGGIVINGSYSNQFVVSISDCSIYGNSTFRNAGGIDVNYGTAVITNCTICDNTSGNCGGGIVVSYGTSTLTNCTIYGNSSSMGGGIYSSGTKTLINCAIYGNIGRRGGGIYTVGNPTVTNCTITGNVADYGGGIYAVPGQGTTTLRNTIVAANYANTANADYEGSISTTSSNNAVGFNPGFTVAPEFDSNGNLTNADLLDLRLASGALGIDSGDNSFVLSTTDLDGNERIAKSYETDAAVDLGAYEFIGTFERTLETASTVVTTLADIVGDSDGVVSLREALEYAQSGDTITFDHSLDGGRIVLNGAALFVNKNVVIDATSLSNGLTINGGRKSTVFSVSGGTTSAPVKLIGLTITGGKADYGGGVYTFNYGKDCTSLITNCSFIENVANYGGGICTFDTTTLETCAIMDNNASYYGGGIYAYAGMTTLTNSSIIDNNASSYGGGICAEYGTTTSKNCTINGNVAKSDGGGVYTSSTCNFYNTIIACNSLTSGSSSDVCSSGSSKLYAYNVLSSYASWTKNENCLVYDPTFPLFADADNGDYSLAEGSQAIDKGADAYAVDADGNALTTDLAGNERIFGASVDLGAYEYVPKAETPALVVTTELDVVDETDGLISLREAIAYVGTNGLGTTITFDPSLKGKTITLNGTRLEIDKTLTIDASSLADQTTGAPGVALDVEELTFGDAVQIFGLSIQTSNVEVAGSLEFSDSSLEFVALNDVAPTFDVSGSFVASNVSFDGAASVWKVGAATRATNATFNGDVVLAQDSALELAERVTINGTLTVDGEGGASLVVSGDATIDGRGTISFGEKTSGALYVFGEDDSKATLTWNDGLRVLGLASISGYNFEVVCNGTFAPQGLCCVEGDFVLGSSGRLYTHRL